MKKPMQRFLHWLIWLPNPRGRREYEARQARLVQMEFWAAECSRLYALFLKDPDMSLVKQYRVASHRYDKEASRK